MRNDVFDLKTKVLVVDDMSIMRKIVSKALRLIGFADITEAVDGKDAWEKVSSARPEFGLIISDWNMPRMTGLELLKHVRNNELLSKTPFLLVTAEGEKHQVAEALILGVDQYVIKPFNHETLKNKLEMAYKKCKERSIV
jgi:two-component system, chemotaxis family, chemotaxis protein CheY